jgi:hypothetical protein
VTGDYYLRDVGVAGSNPVTPTNKTSGFCTGFTLQSHRIPHGAPTVLRLIGNKCEPQALTFCQQ